jgi:hypothetical protein
MNNWLTGDPNLRKLSWLLGRKSQDKTGSLKTKPEAHEDLSAQQRKRYFESNLALKTR